MIIGISGRKQSGKSTAGNLIYSLYMAQLDLSEKIFLSEDGELIITDLYGDKTYEGIFNPHNYLTTDLAILRAFSELDQLVKIYNFADVLKREICIKLLGLTYDQCYGTDEQKNTLTDIRWEDIPDYTVSWSHNSGFMTARQIMQYVGTDMFRKMRNNVWVDATINKIKEDNVPLAIITDCRFPNEVSAIKNNNGKIIRLTRDPFNSDHISESVLDADKYDWSNFDYVVDNTNYSLIDQSSKIKAIIEEITQL